LYLNFTVPVRYITVVAIILKELWLSRKESEQHGESFYLLT
jgi:hypothetical protein